MFVRPQWASPTSSQPIAENTLVIVTSDNGPEICLTRMREESAMMTKQQLRMLPICLTRMREESVLPHFTLLIDRIFGRRA